jgi:uncharacterized protein YbjT (DUF2867 family)
MLVLIVGATGVIGRETARCLRAAGQSVRGMTRSAERARDLAARGIEPVIGDLVDAASLDRACAGIDAVVAAAHSMLGRGKHRSEAVDDLGHRSLIDAAKRARVGRFVYLSARGVAPDHPIDFFRTKWAIEQYLAASGLAYTVLRPSAIMEWHAHTFNGKSLLEKGRTVILGTGTKRRNFVAARDVALVIAQVLATDAPAHRIMSIVGPGDYSNDEVAQLYASMAGVPARTAHLPRGVAATLSTLARPLHPGIARIMRLSGLRDDAFPETSDTADLASEHVVGAVSLETFIRERVLEHRAARTI